ncbi:MAG: hypothetical protein K0R38_2372 [Polyangiaceae bacterium]|jgi:hypothetical protein|nr:hypothetical protein [Polyangiaceae bacterium]
MRALSRSRISISRRRRQQRGAVFVEAIVVSSMLMMFMAGGLFMHRLYVAQHKALEQARLAAWSQGLKGCASPVDLPAIWSATGENEASVDVEAETAPGFFGTVAHTSAGASETASAHARIGGGSFTTSASDSVACNEIAQDPKGRVAKNLIGYISSNLLPSML